ncbi:hypothetical protein BDW59DRAFT_161455 [Aspergillus cavernicola]|uniref:MYND-type domain-containing protein n=1 Tax=Aspergillus cavernicola TaxID=176166 RepID=A0ABR4IDH0_9EURO
MSQDPPKCATCGTEAMLQCAGCIDAPAYQSNDSKTIVYCNSDCQKKHRPTHKAHCNSMAHRRKLHRTAIVLKAAVLTYRAVNYDIDLTKLELRDGVLLLHHRPRASTDSTKRAPFPSNLTDNIEYKEAALTVNQCTAANALSGRLARKLLVDVPSKMETLDLHIGKPALPTKLIPGADSTQCPHTVLKVELLRSQETWVIDTTGRQYGFREVLVPYAEYVAEKECRIVGPPAGYFATETKDLDFFLTLPFMTGTKAQRDGLEVERRHRMGFASFVDTAVEKGILHGSVVRFGGKLEGFKGELRAHLLQVTGR